MKWVFFSIILLKLGGNFLLSLTHFSLYVGNVTLWSEVHQGYIAPGTAAMRDRDRIHPLLNMGWHHVNAYDWGMLVKWPRGSLDWQAAESQQVLHNPSRLERVLSALSCFLSQGLVSALLPSPFLPRLAEPHLLFSWGLMVATRWQYLWVLCFHWRVKAASGRWGCMFRNDWSRLRVKDIFNY